MPFDSGTISYRRFAVVGSGPSLIDQDLLDKLSEKALRPEELGIPEEIEYGWSGGRHILDSSFGFDTNVFAEALQCALRIDTNKVPSNLTKAFRLIEEEAAAKENPSGFISKRQKQIAKETAVGRLEEELRTGKFRRSKLLPVFWDLPGALLLSPASNKSFEVLSELFERTFTLSLAPLSAGVLALRILEAQGRRRAYEDATPTRFVIGPEGQNQRPEYPWVAKGPEAKDFFGNEFLLWLWHSAFIHEGAIRIEGGGEASVFLEQVLDLDCAFGQTGRDTLRGDGVTRMPEAVDALRSGKVPRRIGLILEHAGQQVTFKLSAESLAISGLKLPDVEEADTPRVLFEERIALLREFHKTFDGLFATFLKLRTGGAWEREVDAIRKWIMQLGRATPVGA